MGKQMSVVFRVLVFSSLAVFVLSGCSDKGNEPVKDGKTVTSDRAAMQKMYQGGGATQPK